MNVQDVIEKALAGNDGIPVTPVEHSSCEDVQVEKLASALNFIGANLESSVDELEKAAYSLGDIAAAGPDVGSRKIGKASQVGYAGLAGGGIGAVKARKKMREAGMSEADIDKTLSVGGGTARGAIKGLGGMMAGGAAGLLLAKTPLVKSIGAARNLGNITSALGGLGGGALSYKHEMDRANKAIAEAKGQKKTASVDEALYHAAQAGKQALLEKNAEAGNSLGRNALDASVYGSTLAGGVGAHLARKRMRKAGISEEEIDDLVTRTSGTARGAGASLLGGMVGSGIARSLGAKNNSLADNLAFAVPSALGGLSAYKSQTNRADRAIKRHKARQKTASFTKVAEDRINPAKISAGAAAPYSGEIMPKGQAVFGGATTPAQLVALKAQKVRNRINKDMKQYVKNVGDGYNLQGHLTKFNK